MEIEKQSLANQIIKLAIEKNLKIAVSESCTGGLISSKLTDIPGCSACFMGGITAYANIAKQDILKVNEQTLIDHGAVSKETALKMAKETKTILKADISISTTGIAGPTGGTKDKPVGTIGIGFCTNKKSGSDLFKFSGDRIQLKEQFAEAAMQILLDKIKSF